MIKTIVRILIVLAIMAGIILLIVKFALPMISGKKAAIGDTISVDYVGRLEDGTLFDTSKEETAKGTPIYISTPNRYKPLEFTIGSGIMIKGFENAVIGMKIKETKKVTLKADEAYGEYQQNLIVSVPLSTFTSQGIQPEIGKTYNFSQGIAKAASISGDQIMLDFNHSLAGKTLIFEITLLSIK